MPTVELDTSGADGVAVVRLNRPERLNAVTAELVDDLLTALDALTVRTDVRAVVLTGEGRAFCAGHDLKEPAPEGDSRPRLERLQDVTRRLRGLPQPVVAAVHGYAIGAGAEFALGCDLVVAADDAAFAFPEAGLGLSVTGAASRLLPLLVGPLKAKELMLLGERIDAAAAAELGLVNRVVPRDELDSRVTELASALADKPPRSVTLAKRALDHGVDAAVETVLELEVTHALLTEHTPEVDRSAEEFRSR
ncbi:MULTISPECIES: enoyl-CoA hydratase/isomerase family protein [Prauserella salsuginis group]|uniref:Enoyl-CoA hydratase/carnithine racemase n=2 Tax=Prauserella salsuginis group TaxID=2893672 RepID=A0A839XNP0_9PSEU|nr:MULTISPECIES: enoyl-CoA hydratase-related protein [Prauserella salsuginis group]MBB3663529.1 enoyl-CoA hydratase/carnithine racemase [Prauserella sediminis]MCR3720652.1 Enoyl-CoA hydratase/carnithine racemase [Prauserella flava]MCR3735267.1 Enoyl-CoA hydratase/carnithine racemase [Prauserella salsuginis]